MRTLVLFALSLTGVSVLTEDASALGRRKKKSSCQPACASPCGYSAGFASGGYAAAPAFVGSTGCNSCSAGYASSNVWGANYTHTQGASFAAPVSEYSSAYTPGYTPAYHGGGYYGSGMGVGSGVGLGTGFGTGNMWGGVPGVGSGIQFGTGNMWGGMPGQGLWR